MLLLLLYVKKIGLLDILHEVSSKWTGLTQRFSATLRWPNEFYESFSFVDPNTQQMTAAMCDAVRPIKSNLVFSALPTCGQTQTGLL